MTIIAEHVITNVHIYVDICMLSSRCAHACRQMSLLQPTYLPITQSNREANVFSSLQCSASTTRCTGPLPNPSVACASAAMGLAPMYMAVVLLATIMANLAAAQTQDKAENVGTPAATSQSQKYTVPPNGAWSVDGLVFNDNGNLPGNLPGNEPACRS